MHSQTLCAQVARRTGDSLKTIERRGFQLSKFNRPADGPKLSAVDCPFCGRHTIVAPTKVTAFDVECRSCDTVFSASLDDVFAITLAAAEKPNFRPRMYDDF